MPDFWETMERHRKERREKISEETREAERLYTLVYAEYKDIFGDFKSLLSLYAEPGRMYPSDMTNLQMHICHLSEQSEKVRLNKMRMTLAKGRERRWREEKNEQL